MPIQKTSYLYRPVISQAFAITKKFKNLWIFGLFAVFVSVGGEYEIITRWLLNSNEEGLINALILSFREGWKEGELLSGGNFWQNFSEFIFNNFPALMMTIFILLLILVLTVIGIWFTVTCMIALVKSLSIAIKNRKIKALEAFALANENFWSVLGALIIFKSFLFVLFALLSWELWLIRSLGSFSWLLSTLSFFLFAGIALTVSFILKYQLLFLIIKKKKLIESYKLAWNLFLSNWIISIEMALIMFGAYLVATVLAVFLVVLFAAIPIVVVPFYLFGLPLILNIIISILAMAIGFLGVLLVSASVTVFQWAGWVALFDRLVGGEDIPSKIQRLPNELRSLPSYFK